MGIAWCSFSKYDINAGSILDRVISQASDEDECLLYRLANYKKGGELIDAYNTGGQTEVEKFIREQFSIFLYNDGKGQTINRSEYLRWRFRNQSQVILPIEACLSRHDPLGKWRDHEACWQMQYRGSLGETLLHVLIICDTKTHTKLARLLLKCFPRLSIDCVEGEEYLGASALHLAIAYNNNELVQDLIEAGANVNQRALGSFFLPRDQQRRHPSRHTDYEGLAYLGEFPLSWSACCANESVYNLLLDNGANPDMQDSFGNMILHMVVVGDKLDMFGYALRHPKVPASNGIQNHAGLTPLTLACKLGRASVFREMLELSCREFWRYSNITCSAYPLNALDTLLPDGRTSNIPTQHTKALLSTYLYWNSALFIILNGTKEEHLDMLDGGIIQRLLEEKWKTFARRQFLKRLAILFLHLFMLSMAIYLRPTEPDEPLLGGMEWNDIIRYCFEVGTVCGVLSYIIIQQGGEMMNQGICSFIKQLPNEPAKAIFLISNVLILACIPFRLIGDKQTEEAILVFAVPGSWFLLMFFAGAVRLTGPFVTMVYLMITGDMLTFGIIYSIVLFGFSQSFYFLYKGSPGVETSLYSSYPSTWMALFQITLGDYNYSELSSTVYPAMSKTVFTMFMVLVPILLLNMLIAMMGNTYAHVIEQSEKEWMKQWAKIVVALERAVNQKDAQRYLQEYSIKLGPGDDPSTEQRGVMVIKSKSKTRAKQRKGAVANWKRVGKVTINALRKRGMTGEQLRRVMWGRESISTPVKNALSKANTFDNTNDAANPASTFSGALTAALDVMAFSHDIDLTGKNKSADRKTSKDSYALSQNISASSPDISDDPFRQLVLSADDPKAKEKELSNLAAAAVAYVEISQEKAAIASKSSHPSLSTSVSIKQEQCSVFPEQSDSDSLGKEYLLLGQQSRARRVRSAQIRNARKHSSVSSANTRKLYPTNFPDVETSSNTSSLEYNACYANPPSYASTMYQSHTSSEHAALFQKNIHPKQRPKTAKVNRVAPSPIVPQRSGSALPSENNRIEALPDPLKPWSTRGIANMNTILAWDQSDPDT